MPEDTPAVFSISSIAKMLSVHPQTLRFYERAGFVKPVRTRGDTRLYSQQDIAQSRPERDAGQDFDDIHNHAAKQHPLRDAARVGLGDFPGVGNDLRSRHRGVSPTGC